MEVFKRAGLFVLKEALDKIIKYLFEYGWYLMDHPGTET